ncbi:MAG TPA: ABC transporter permease [Mycobacteriales bacterium]|nr:ABC transporter permease [Mycobacteriales bacterium]
MTATTTATSYVPRIAPVPGARPLRIVERQMRVYRTLWPIFLTGFIEPLFFLGSIGLGVGKLIHTLPGPFGHPVSYASFVAPALLATSAMNGAVIDVTFGFFVNFKYRHTYDAVLATPMRVVDVAIGEVGWALMRGALYSCVFLATMAGLGYVHSPWALLAAPVAVLIGLAFGAAGLAASTWMRSFIDFDLVTLALVPLFLFSAVFFPLSRYPAWLAELVRITPLYQGVAVERRLVFGPPQLETLGHVVYLAALAVVAIIVASRRLRILLQP